MQIVVFRVHKINVGEAIVTKGAVGCVQEAFPNADVIEVSLFPDKIFRRIQQDSLIVNLQSVIGLPNYSINSNHTRIVDLIDADLAVIPGGILRPGIDQFMQTFGALREKKIPIVLLGAGGNGSVNYTDSTLQPILLEAFEELDIRVLITRDSLAYDALSNNIEYAHDGIDCGFFIDDWYQPPFATKPFSTIAFDKSPAPDISTKHEPIYPYHKPFDNPYRSLPHRVLNAIHPNRGGVDVRHDVRHKDRIFISDNIKEYLFLYANTNVTHSDRMHACIPTLAYGGKARVYTDDLRRHIFDGLVNGNVVTEPVEKLESTVEDKKQEQVSVLQEAVKIVL
jgi:hypothetical protein